MCWQSQGGCSSARHSSHAAWQVTWLLLHSRGDRHQPCRLSFLGPGQESEGPVVSAPRLAVPAAAAQAASSGFSDTHSWSPVSLQRDLRAAGAVVPSKSASSPRVLPAWDLCIPGHFPVASSMSCPCSAQGALWLLPSRRAEHLSWGDTDPHGDFLREGAAGHLHRLGQGRWLLYVVFKNVAMLSFFSETK